METEKTGAERIYPAAPLEMPLVHEQSQKLLPQEQQQPQQQRQQQHYQLQPPPPPPTYDQATGIAPTTADGSHVVIITQPQVPYGPHPVDVQCPFCHNYTRTRIRYKPTSRTHLLALLLCVLQLYCCICLPYCCGTFMSANHYCGICDRYLGTYDRV